MPSRAAGAWLLGIIMGLLSILGLVMASAAVDTIFYVTGLALTAFGILFVFFLINKNVG